MPTITERLIRVVESLDDLTTRYYQIHVQLSARGRIETDLAAHKRLEWGRRKHVQTETKARNVDHGIVLDAAILISSVSPT
jgi:hypothetical protein